jgi:hypothetical protein
LFFSTRTLKLKNRKNGFQEKEINKTQKKEVRAKYFLGKVYFSSAPEY